MIPVYNFLQVILLVIGFPVILALVLARDKYRGRIGQRLGIGLGRTPLCTDGEGRKRIWIHCLSVGEVTSAVPFVRELRRRLPDACIIFSAATATGMMVAGKRIRPHVDHLIAAPLDFLPAVQRFVDHLRPDLFILVETDFWPNWLDCLRRRGIPAMLINGRISPSSFRTYNRLRFFFAPLFGSFSMLAMQTASDAEQVRRLGAPADRVAVLGNLKYDTAALPAADTVSPPDLSRLRLPDDSIVWICGSTHNGEEEIILTAFSRLQGVFPLLALIVAPRNPVRGRDILTLAGSKGLQAGCRTTGGSGTTRLLILDTIGELTECYRLARLAFIGGSLVDRGGHNPLEAAAYGVPTLFGPHMEDFAEIARDLVQEGGARIVHSAEEMTGAVRDILAEPDLHGKMSRAAAGLITRGKGVVARHIDAAQRLLNPS